VPEDVNVAPDAADESAKAVEAAEAADVQAAEDAAPEAEAAAEVAADSEPDTEEPVAETEAADAELGAGSGEPESGLADQLFDLHDESDGTDEDDVHQPVRKLTKAPVKKAQPARKRAATTAPTTTGRTTPWAFVRQAIGELRKVVWPSGEIVGQYFIVVLVFVLFIMLVVFGLDTFFGWGLMRIFR